MKVFRLNCVQGVQGDVIYSGCTAKTCVKVKSKLGIWVESPAM